MSDPYPVGPGWWKLLDTYLPGIYASDKEISKVDIKEKYGTLRVDFVSGSDEAFRFSDAITDQSAEICENCGGQRRPDGRQPWCQRCRAATPAEFREIRTATEKTAMDSMADEPKNDYSSYIRTGPPQDRSRYRQKRLEDFIHGTEEKE